MRNTRPAPEGGPDISSRGVCGFEGKALHKSTHRLPFAIETGAGALMPASVLRDFSGLQDNTTKPPAQ